MGAAGFIRARSLGRAGQDVDTEFGAHNGPRFNDAEFDSVNTALDDVAADEGVAAVVLGVERAARVTFLRLVIAPDEDDDRRDASAPLCSA